MRTLAVVAVSWLMTVPALAQAVRSDETIRVTLVEVPVTVTTVSDEPIRGLTKANFEVYDQGQKREITNFEMIDFAALAGQPAAAAAAAAARGAARRNFMLLFDLGNSDPTSLVRAREATLEFVDKQLLPGDRAAVGSMSPQRGFQLHAMFSTDRKLVREAINSLGLSEFQMSAGDPLRITMRDFGFPRNSMQPAGQGRALVPMIEALKEISLGSLRANDENKRRYLIGQIADFTAMGSALDRVAGRKEVILLSEGFDPKMLHGRQSSSTSEETENENAAAESGELWKVSMDARYGSTEAKSELQRMVDALRRSDVVLNAVDIKGLRGSVDLRGSSEGLDGIAAKSNDALHLLTRDTGGKVFRNTNDLGQDLARMLKAHEVTYVLGFSGAAGTPGKFHNLKVKAVNVPGARLSHRAGYYEPAPISSEFDRLLSAGEIIVNSIPVDAVKVAAMAAAFPRANGPAEVAVIVQVDGRKLVENAKGTTAQTEFFMYAFDSEELIRDFTYQKVEFDLSKTRDRLANRGVKFYGTLNLPAGDYTIRTLVRDGTNDGFVSVPLHVPALGEPSAAIALHDTAEWLMVKGQQRSEEPYPFQVGETAIIPSAMPVLAAGTYDVAVLMYNIPTDNLNVAAHLEDSAGAAQTAPLSLIGRTEPDPATGGAKLLFRFTPPPKLARGDYSLVVDLREENGGDARRVTLPFRVD